MSHVLAKKPQLRNEGTISGLDMALGSAAGGWLHAGAAVRFAKGPGIKTSGRG